MKAFFLLVFLFMVFLFTASSGLGQVDLTPDTPALAGQSVPVTGSDVISIQDSTGGGQNTVYTAPTTKTVYQVPVTGPRVCSNPYTIRTGDSLSGIAALCNTSMAVIRQANPGITNANLIYPGQQITIPGAPSAAQQVQQVPVPVTGNQAQVEPTVVPTDSSDMEIAPTAAPNNSSDQQIAPTAMPNNSSDQPVAPSILISGQAPVIRTGTGLQVKAISYPRNTPVNIAIGPQNQGYDIVASGITDAHGSFTAHITVPTSPNAQTTWVVVVATTGNPPIQAMSQPFYIGPAAP